MAIQLPPLDDITSQRFLASFPADGQGHDRAQSGWYTTFSCEDFPEVYSLGKQTLQYYLDNNLRRDTLSGGLAEQMGVPADTLALTFPHTRRRRGSGRTSSSSPLLHVASSCPSTRDPRAARSSSIIEHRAP